jgi:hypothetical protein
MKICKLALLLFFRLGHVSVAVVAATTDAAGLEDDQVRWSACE